MFKMKKKISRLASLIVSAAICAPLFLSVGVARAAGGADAAVGLDATPASRATVGVSSPTAQTLGIFGTSGNKLVTTNPRISTIASATPAFAPNPVTPQSTISEIRLTSSTTSVVQGALHEFTVGTTTQYASVIPYGEGSDWVYRTPSYASWFSFGANDPYALNDGTTRYGLFIVVSLDKGYVFDDSPTIYFNGTNVTPASSSLNVFTKQNDRSATIIIDLGLATGSGNVVRRTVTFDSNGGSSVPPVTVINGNKVAKPLNPTREGMYFWGWYKDPDFKTKYSFDDQVLKSMTLYAQWKNYANNVYEVVLTGDVITIEPGQLPKCNIRATSDGVYLNTADGNSEWIKWNGYSYVWDYEKVDPYGVNLTADDDDRTHYGMQLYLRAEDGYIFSRNFNVIYKDPNGKTIDLSTDVHTGRENHNDDGYAYLTIDFGLAKAPAPVVFDFYTGSDSLSVSQLDALDFLAKRNLVLRQRMENDYYQYCLASPSHFDIKVWETTGKMELYVGHSEGSYSISSKDLTGSHFTSITFDFPESEAIELYRGELTPDTSAEKALTFLETNNAAIVRKYTGSILQYDLDRDGTYDIQWDKSQNILKTLPTNSIRWKYSISEDYLKESKYSAITFYIRYPYSVYLAEGAHDLSDLEKKALTYLADNHLIDSKKLGKFTAYDLDQDETFDVSVNEADQISKLASTNLSGYYTIREDIPMDSGIESFTFIFTDDLVFDFRNGPVDGFDNWYWQALSYLESKDLITKHRYDFIDSWYYDLDRDGNDDIKSTDDFIEMLPTCTIEGDYAIFGAALNGYLDSITFRFSIQISSVSLSIKAPASGASPSFYVTLPSGVPFVTTSSVFTDKTSSSGGVIWMDLTTGTRLKTSGASYAADHRYEVAIGLIAAKGYYFKSGATVKINGYNAVQVINNGNTLVACLRFAALKPTATPTPVTDKTLEVGKSFQYTVSGVSATSITWSVGNTTVATVSSDGTVTGKSVGNTWLTAILPDGQTIKCLIRVVYPTLKICYTEKTLHINQTFSFNVSGAAGEKITWSIGNTDVAEITDTGPSNCNVIGKSAANTYLYAKSADGRTAKCLLRIVDPGTLSINYTEKTIYLGQTFTFTVKNPGFLTPGWSVGNTEIATVIRINRSTAKVTPKNAGNTYLYVTTEDGRSAKCLLKIVDPGPLSITYTEKTIKVGESFTFTAKNPAGQTVTWKVGNTAVATVSSTGAATAKVTGKTVANTYLYASTPDGREVKCLIKVVA